MFFHLHNVHAGCCPLVGFGCEERVCLQAYFNQEVTEGHLTTGGQESVPSDTWRGHHGLDPATESFAWF